jgi:hypothetical protein
MNSRYRNVFIASTACLAGGLIAGLSCDPNYASHQHPGTGGGGMTAGTGGAPGTGGQPGVGGTPGVGGQTQGGTGGEMAGGTGGEPSGTGGSQTGTGGSQPGTGGQTGTGGAGAPNLITNGDFSNGATDWTFQLMGSGSATATHGVMNGQYCVTVGTNQNLIVGWPDTGNGGNTLNLPPNTAYVFSYTASSTTTSVFTDMDAKVGQDATPYTADFEIKTDAVGTGPTPFTHTFTTSSAGDTIGGVGFFINGPTTGTATSTVCIDNVSLTLGS